MNFARLKKYLVLKNYTNYVKWHFGDKAKHTYSQNGEDRIITFIFRALGIANPSYLDIGAHDPYYASNTALLYENGSLGINIEPNPFLFKEFLSKRERDINLNIGIADTSGVMDFYIMSQPSLSTFSKEEAERMEKEYGFRITRMLRVAVETVEQVLEEHMSGAFPDFLSIDIEGLDEAVLRSLDFTVSKPKVICVETVSFSPKRDGVKNHALIAYIKSEGYLLLADTYINSIFVDAALWNKPS